MSVSSSGSQAVSAVHASGFQWVSFPPQGESLPENEATQRKAESRGGRDKDIELLDPAMPEDSDPWNSWLQGSRAVFIWPLKPRP